MKTRRHVWRTPRNTLASFLLACCAAASAEQYTIPLFVAASPGGDPQGVLRLANDADAAATVAIHAIDDAGAATGPATLTLNALAAVELSATELQSGNAAKGLTSGLGALAGEVRLAIDSDLPVTPSAYVRGADGTLTAMNPTVLGAVGIGQAIGAGQDAGAGRSATGGQDAHRYGIALFHPASHAAQPSRLRLINTSGAAAQVTIEARDDAGHPAPGGAVRLTLPANGARTLTAQDLEAGDSGANAAFAGRLGAGAGNWRLSVTSDRPIQAVNVTVGAAGGWHNLSTTAVGGWAPTDAAAFEARFLDRTMVLRSGGAPRSYRVLGDGRIGGTGATVGGAAQAGLHNYRNTGRDTARISLKMTPEPGSDSGTLPLQCDVDLNFAAAGGGWYSSACANEPGPGESALGGVRLGGVWSILEPGATPLDLGPGPDDRFYTVGAAIEPLTLPSAASGGQGELGYSLTPDVPGLVFDPATRTLGGTPAAAGRYAMTWRVHDASGATDWRRFGIVVAGAADDASTSYAVGDTLSELPDEAWRPDAIANGSYTASGDGVAIELDRGGYFESGGHRYTCQSAMGCTVNNRELASGSILRTALDSGSGDGGNGDGGEDPQDDLDDHGDDAASATAVAVGSDTPGALDAGDVDYFAVTVTAAGTLEVYSSGGIDTYGHLEDAGGAQVARNDDSGAGRNFRVSREVDAGVWYVRVRGYSDRVTGGYTLHVRFTETDSGTTPPGGGGTGGNGADTSPSFASVTGPGDRSYTVGTAITALTLPAASGGDGALTYTLTPSVPGLTFDAATRRLAGSPTAAGAYDVTYTATDADGDTAALAFAIVVEEPGDAAPDFECEISQDDLDDHGDDAASATAVAACSDTPGALDAGDADYFAVTVTAPGRLAVYTTGTTDTEGRLVDAGGAALDSDNSAGTTSNFWISQAVEAGTYFVRVAGQYRTTTGDYTLHVRFDSPSLAAPVEAGSDTQATLTYDEAHWFRIEVTAPGRLAVYTTGTTDTEGRLVDADGATLDSDDSAGTTSNFWISQAVESGTYFVRVAGQYRTTTGDYTLHVRFDSPSLAAPVEAGSDTQATLTYDEAHWFRIEVTAPGRLAVYTTGTTDTEGRLVDAGGAALDSDNSAGTTSNFWISQAVEAGTYFVRVAGQYRTTTGDYTLHVRFDSPSLATPVEAGSDTQATLTYDEAHWFRIEVTAPGRLAVYTTGTTDTEGRLVDAGGAALDSDNSAGTTSNFWISQAVEAGTYFVRVAGQYRTTTGDYTLHVRFDSPSLATPVEAGSDTQATLTYDEAHWFRIEVTAPGRLAVYTTGTTDTEGRLVDADGATLDSDDSAGTTSNFRVSQDVEAGTYFVRVAGQYRNTTGDYTLHVRLHVRFDTPSSATRIEAGSDIPGTLTAGEAYWFRIEVDAPGRLEVYTTGRTDTFGRLEDSGGTRVRRKNDDGGEGHNFRISAAVAAGTYFVGVAGYDSSTTGDYTLHARFTESESGTELPSFGIQATGDRTYAVGASIGAFTLPAATGGDGDLSYSLTPTVPGLTFDPLTRELTGTPTTGGTYDMIYTATDADGDSDTLRFEIHVDGGGGGGGSGCRWEGNTLVCIVIVPAGTIEDDIAASDGGNASLRPRPDGETTLQ